MSRKATPSHPDNEGRIVVFQEQAIRRIWHDDDWWFSVVDVCAVLTDSRDAGAYWRKLKQRLGAEGSEVVTFFHGLKLEAPDGKQRGVTEGREYSILTAEIARATFGVTPGDHKKLKGLEQARAANLRDHMTDLELIFTMLGEASTTEIARRKDAQGFRQNKTAAKEGGTVAGNARKELEAKSGKPVVSRENYLAPPGTDVSEISSLPPPRKKPGKKP